MRLSREKVQTERKTWANTKFWAMPFNTSSQMKKQEFTKVLRGYTEILRTRGSDITGSKEEKNSHEV